MTKDERRSSDVTLRHWPSLIVIALGAGCQKPTSVPIVGPDGSPMFHVSCGGDEARCFELAGAACPSGYEMTSTAGRNLLVRCRDASLESRGVETALAPSPYAYAPPPLTGTETLAPNPYRPAPVGPAAPAPTGTATFPPLSAPAPRGPRGDVGY